MLPSWLGGGRRPKKQRRADGLAGRRACELRPLRRSAALSLLFAIARQNQAKRRMGTCAHARAAETRAVDLPVVCRCSRNARIAIQRSQTTRQRSLRRVAALLPPLLPRRLSRHPLPAIRCVHGMISRSGGLEQRSPAASAALPPLRTAATGVPLRPWLCRRLLHPVP